MIFGPVEFLEDFNRTYGPTTWEEKAYPRFKQVIRSNLNIVKESMKTHRKNTFEFFAYDMMLDENFDVWLMEINRNPYSKRAPVVPRMRGDEADLVFEMLTDILKVTIDYVDDKSADTGGWKLIT